MDETFTIALGAERRRIGSSASVSRTTASKLSSIVRRTFSQPPSSSPNAALQPAPALFTSRCKRALGLDALAHAGGGVVLCHVERQRRGVAQLAGQRLEPVGAASYQQQPPAVAVEPLGGGLADARGRTGDERDLHGSIASTSAAASRAMRERGTTRSTPAASAWRRTSCSTCE